MRGCKLKSEKELKKEGRCSYDGSVDLNSGIAIMRWFGNKAVQSIYLFIYLFIYLLYLTLVYKIVKNNSTNKYQQYQVKI